MASYESIRRLTETRGHCMEFDKKTTQDTSLNATIVIGEGAHRYRVDHDWAQLPADRQFGYTHGIVGDRSGRIYIANQSADAVMVFDADGHYIDSWGAAYEEGAHGLTIAEEDGQEVLYLANTGLAEVVKTTLDGEVLWKRGAPDLPGVYDDDHPYSPTETAVAPDGTVYVADGYGQFWIHVYDRDGTYRHSFGGAGEEAHHLNGPHGISIDARGDRPVVQVADRTNVRIVNYELDGTFIETVIAPSELRFPCTTFHAGGNLYVPDLFTRLSIFGADNRKVIDLGDYVEGRRMTEWDDILSTLPGYPNIPHERRLPGKFVSPHGVWVDEAGDIYLAEWIEDGRVTKLTRL